MKKELNDDLKKINDLTVGGAIIQDSGVDYADENIKIRSKSGKK